MALELSNFYDLQARTLNGDIFQFDQLKNSVVLIVNVASFWGDTTDFYYQLTELHNKYKDGLVILGFPCNQFGYQEPGKNDEILKCLENVRPGNGYKCPFLLMNKVEVNGKNADKTFLFLKKKLPGPREVLMDDPKFIIWSPVSRNDIVWNFEMFLIDKNGIPFKRVNHTVPPKDLEKDIVMLLNQ